MADAMTPEQRARLEEQARFSQTDDLRVALAHIDALAAERDL